MYGKKQIRFRYQPESVILHGGRATEREFQAVVPATDKNLR